MKKTPKQLVLDRFGSRAELVNEVLSLLGDDKDDRTSARLKAAKNAQLLRLHEVLTQVKDQFGNKAGLIKAIAEKKYGSAKPDASYITKLETYTQKRLFDLYGRNAK